MKYKKPDEVMIILDEAEVKLLGHILVMVRLGKKPRIGPGQQEMFDSLSVALGNIQFPETSRCDSCSNYEDSDY